MGPETHPPVSCTAVALLLHRCQYPGYIHLLAGNTQEKQLGQISHQLEHDGKPAGFQVRSVSADLNITKRIKNSVGQSLISTITCSSATTQQGTLRWKKTESAQTTRSQRQQRKRRVQYLSLRSYILEGKYSNRFYLSDFLMQEVQQ